MNFHSGSYNMTKLLMQLKNYTKLGYWQRNAQTYAQVEPELPSNRTPVTFRNAFNFKLVFWVVQLISIQADYQEL